MVIMWALLLCSLLHRISPIAGEKPRIVGGQATTISQAPYQVYLRQNGNFICGGSLITPSCVLSAAHCVYGAQPGDFTVHAGASHLREPAPVVSSVENLHVAPTYNPTNFDMDVAILQLTEPVPLQQNVVETIGDCRVPPANYSNVTITGWGVQRENSREPAEQLRSAVVRVLPRVDCQLSYVGQAQLSDSMMCAAVRGRKDSCSGDSGGPLMYRRQVCGIVSWGFGCARTAYPGVYTNVASHRVRSFISQIRNANCNNGA